MKKRSLKIMSVVLAGVMTTGMILGGCSAGGDKENGGNKEASKELNLWMHNGQAFVDETKKLAENYEKETGVKINIQTFPYDAMSQKMKAAFTAGNEPDIMQVFGAWIPTYMNQKLLAEVPEELSANFETDYLQGAVDGYAKDGTYYGVPIEMNVEYGLFYNREDAAAAGVPDGPKTFDDVMKIAKNSAKFNGDVQEYGGLEFYNGDNFAALFLSWIMQNGGDFWNEDQTKFVLTSPEAKKGKENLYHDYYIWKDTIPNNWGSSFGGPAWEYVEETAQYYLHLFAKEQPDLNWENPKVRKEVQEILRFWLEKGIDGFRMDVITLISKDPAYPDGPVIQNKAYGSYYAGCASGPRVHEYLQEMNREVLSKYDIMTVGEAPHTSADEAAPYTASDRHELNMVFHFDHMC